MSKKTNFNEYNTEKILSVGFSTLSKQKLIKAIALRLTQKKRTVIFTPNPQMLLEAQKSPDLLKLLNSADINVPDGIGVVLASRLKGGRIQCRVSGIDLAESVLALSQKRGYRVFLLGAEKGVAKMARKRLKKRYPRLNVCGTYHGYFNKTGKENKKVVSAINKTRPDVIFVCFGYPMQERWIIKNAPSLPSAKLFIGLGGSLDVWSGKSHRAPEFFKQFGLEWLYRTIKEPKRARIFLDIPRFLYKILK